ncbi:MAG: c-type cytochrome [Bryobacteraceae bacterium]
MDLRIANTRTPAALALLLLSLLSAGCANFPSREPPYNLFQDMKRQDKVKYETSSAFFADGRGSRRPVAHTVAQETYIPDVAYATGINADGTYVARNPETIDRALLERGEAKFNVYCSPCHDRTGSGRGIVAARSTWIPGNLHDARIVAFVDGEIFHVATNGRRTMPSYRFQIPEKDRWAIVAYVRALQRAWLGKLDDVPADIQGRLR